MIVFIKGTSVTVDVTLADKTTIDNPFYLLVLNGELDTAEIKFLVTDTSSYPERYQRFTIEEGVDFTGDKQDYKYRFIQKAAAVATYDENDVVLETGIARVIDSADETEYTHTTTEDAVVYEKY